ncbi:Site-specific recombinase XerD [Mucilaginibacter pineti]|uniref:Site-specific recombinase XerD n=1 Tax=Mucilaginibacter pineti TaxID=1391627 RepID=A0A1G7GC65_9SPHI|nr:site-specific integrase [Mucilaginibacter pineti]SDE85683.1 Site-specific recombinase XerD [Mucilaginibacter pineti]
MKVNQELSILFWLWKAKQSNDGLVPIYVRITINGLRDQFSSGKKINADHWNEETGFAVKACKDAAAINAYITLTTKELEKCYNDLCDDNENVTAKMVKDRYLHKPEPKASLMQAFKIHNGEFAEKVAKDKGSPGTLARYDRLQRKVEAFLKKKFKVTDIALDHIQYSFASGFYHYLLMQDIDENTSMKYVKTLKQVMAKAVNEGMIPQSPINNFKCSYKDPDRDYLEMHEIIKIYSKRITCRRIAEVRDVYIFCCFTGYAFETVYALEPENIFTGVDGGLWIRKDRAKSGTEETVPLLPIPLEIIEKYKAHPYCVNENKLLPVNCNQRYNSYLKELADICDIDKHLTTHTARHTFATTITLENDVPIETVSKMLGHKDIRTTQIYAKITKRKISNNMKVLHEKLFENNGPLRMAVSA